MSVALALLPTVEGRRGHMAFAGGYGLLLGGHHYIVKTYLLERTKARDFPQMLSLLQGFQALPVGLGIPIIVHMEDSLGPGVGCYLAAALCFFGFSVLAVSNCCFRSSEGSSDVRMRNKKTQTYNMADQSCTCGIRGVYFDEVDDDFSDEEDEDFENFMGELLAIYGKEKGDAAALFEEDGITSCAKVENDLVFSEFEQNKQCVIGRSGTGGRSHRHHATTASSSTASSSTTTTSGSGGGGKRSGYRGSAAGRLWSLRRQSTEDISLSSSSDKRSTTNSQGGGEAAMQTFKLIPENNPSPAVAGANGNGEQQALFQKQRSITVIEEVSST